MVDNSQPEVNQKPRPRPVLPEELIREEPILEKAYVCVLRERRFASQAMAILANCKHLPCPRHLKRCHGTRIYLAALDRLPEGIHGPAELRQLLADLGLDLALLEDELETPQVPAKPARSKAQMRAATAHWPLHFHPDPRLEALLSGAALADLAPLESAAQLVATAARAAVGGTCCSGAAAILEPSRRGPPRVLALARASLDRHPLWHAAMLAVDLVAHGQGGGAWDLKPRQLEGTGKRLRLRVRRPLVFPPELDSLILVGDDDDDEEEEGNGEEAAYLCTGYWAVLVQEPCPMCAMALLHSRVARIFYGVGNPRAGVLGSRALLHNVPGLNHRYEVWSGLLEAECARALDSATTI
ncbi:probable inactive tRNA-specific adenosine deaminase-like protein 3 [Copidosoma floridanum]|uniref:probable inactive tRNA-specific adenosine deaminase-like protein 3 n=1 Tax=Copidosoma floridanum TaxID=29053 RepID=UPI0006C9D93B|nr:probable inactive tRNA-specific adenosine deaminase-like protein 3 [Copidosoma floridanum]